MLSTKLTIDSGENSSSNAATPAVINTSNDDVATAQILRIDIDAISTTAPKGLIDEVYIYNYARTITEIQTDMNTNSASSTNFYVSNGNGTSTKLGAGGSILLGQ